MACERTAVDHNQSEDLTGLAVKSENVTHGSDSPGQGKNIGSLTLPSETVILPTLSLDMTQEATDEAIEQAYKVMSRMRADGIVFERSADGFAVGGPPEARARWQAGIIENHLIIFTALVCEEVDVEVAIETYTRWVEKRSRQVMAIGITAMLRHEFDWVISVGIDEFNVGMEDAKRTVHEVAARLGFAIQDSRGAPVRGVTALDKTADNIQRTAAQLGFTFMSESSCERVVGVLLECHDVTATEAKQAAIEAARRQGITVEAVSPTLH